MQPSNSIGKVLMLLVFVILLIAGTVFAIDYFAIDPGGLIESKSEISFGASSKLGWLLTIGFVILAVLLSALRGLYYKISGRK